MGQPLPPPPTALGAGAGDFDPAAAPPTALLELDVDPFLAAIASHRSSSKEDVIAHGWRMGLSPPELAALLKALISSASGGSHREP